MACTHKQSIGFLYSQYGKYQSRDTKQLVSTERQQSVNRASTERQLSINRASTECQQSVNRASTEHQQSINRASTEHQRVWVLQLV
jgi:hypothetical protein